MSVPEMDAEDFLELVWGKRKGWVDLPAKSGGHWISYYTLWDGNGCGTSITRRIDASLRDGEDLYFSVGQFSERGRDETDFMASSWLWADLDEVHPSEATKDGLTPTVAWESSAGRYQALWRLDRRVGPVAHDRLNQALSYRLGADRGGWDLTQVLRLPGTRNFKYPDAPLIKVLWHHDDLRYDPKKVWAAVKQWALPTDSLSLGGQGGSLPRRDLPARARRLLRVSADSVVEGERSSRLWELECLLAESGWSEDEIYAAVVDSPWNKWARIRTGERSLRADIKRAIRHVYTHRDGLTDAEGRSVDSEPRDDSGQEDGVSSEAHESPRVRYSTFMAQEMEAPSWMIEGIWTDKSHGIIGGEPKTLKTTLALAMGIAVASGKPFLGTFEVPSPGPVLMVQEENDPRNVQDTMRKVASSYGLISKEEVTVSRSPEGSIGSTVASVRFPDDIPFWLWNNEGLNLTVEESRELLLQDIRELRPKLLILDPIQYCFGDNVDFDRAHEIRPQLRWLMGLRFEYDMAIILIHHFRKSEASRSGQRMLGSTMFHGWTSSALYFKDNTEDADGWKRIEVDREFREQGPQPGLKVGLRMGAPGSLDFDAAITGFDQQSQLTELVMEVPGITVKQAAEIVGVNLKTIIRRANHCPIRIEGGGKGNVRRMYYDGASS